MLEAPTPACDMRLADCPQWYLMPPLDYNMRIPEEVKKCVVFLGIERTKHGVTKTIYAGTGFLVSVQGKKVDIKYLYLVTAKHVVEHLTGETVLIRCNKKDGGSVTFKVTNEVLKWNTHPTDWSADVAVTLATFPDEKFDFRPLPIGMFMTDEMIYSEGIGIGDDVLITGLFSHHSGSERNLPIIRMGNVAMMAEEKIPTKNHGTMDAYLIEAHSIGGISGSPVFVLKPQHGIENYGKVNVRLFGLMHGHWEIDLKTTDSISVDTKKRGGVNLGIAIVTPAHKILETINSPELTEQRAQIETRILTERAPKTD